MAAFTSILGPGVGDMRNTSLPTPDFFADLHLDQIFAAVTAGYGDSDIATTFYAPLRELPTVQYRQQVFCDLDDEQTRSSIQQFVDGARAMRRRLNVARSAWHRLQRQGWLIAAIESYCRAVGLLCDDLLHIRIRSLGLRNFGEHLAGYVNSETFTTLVAETQTMRDQLRKVRYLVHIEGLRVRVEKFDEQMDYSSVVAETFERFATEVSKDYRGALPEFNDMNHVEEQILECVAKLHPETFTLLDSYCRRHEHFIEPVIARFEHEIHFYLSYLAFVDRLTAAGLRFCYPDLTDEPGAMEVGDAFDLALAINTLQEQDHPVTNNFSLSGSERIFVVTGPNQGGKTTFARTIGQCAYLAALGCPIPASRARLTLPDQIFTHFERQEDLSTLHGKLDNELVRIHDILSRATDTSIVIMNESFSSTTVNDALLIGREVLGRIIALHCVAVYVSFLDELSALDPVCVSMVGEVAPDDPTQRTFKFSRRPADGLAYAAALADKYGLSYGALTRRISR
ncbi:MutS-related protein [Mycobacterium vicinigordonae]|uniref:DNA mismatch repair protein MutS n=1 Tax=Mycobacterium vicinigordonae TaxID=1719132 RepID=A0A7D6IBD0_9MYCO|nr:DNA mismatch repair protein MutS [Mycobacterium vicinigordonae]QLL10256.1 DNA mismatch repair protein MutS [Mycobacterium vicinigordonae]